MCACVRACTTLLVACDKVTLQNAVLLRRITYLVQLHLNLCVHTTGLLRFVHADAKQIILNHPSVPPRLQTQD